MISSRKLLNNCGCCRGIHDLTPHLVHNEAGLNELTFRIGKHGSFKESMINKLSRSPELRRLTVREDDDSTIALMDAWALLLDVLTFYNERIINEGYIRTSVERLSLTELARHISYRPKPGVAANAIFAFLMEESPGAPLEALLPIGTKIQSIPEQDEKPQIFETIEEIRAKTKWNAVRPQLTEKQTLKTGTTHLYLQGTATQLQSGDHLLFLGEERINDPTSDSWEIRTIQTVITENEANRTMIAWQEGLKNDPPLIHPTSKGKVYVFRQRAALFGHNAPDYRSLSRFVKSEMSEEYDTDLDEWDKAIVIDGETIHVDANYPKILPQSWLASVHANDFELYAVKKTESLTKKAFVLASNSTKIELDKNFANGVLRETVILAQSEELTLAEAPILKPVYGNYIELGDNRAGFKANQQLIISGQVVREVIVIPSGMAIILALTDSSPVELASGDILTVKAPPEILPDNLEKWFVALGSLEGHVIIEPGDLIPYMAPDTSAIPETQTSLNQPHIVRELITIVEMDDSGKILLSSSLTHVYLRNSVKINGNLSNGTHGETKIEILGSGDGSKVFQKFKLKQNPLTFISSSSASGTESTLEIRVNDILWKEAPTLFGKSREDRIYISRIEEDGSAYVQFGDGITGARLPSGTENVRAEYRVGIGFDGLLNSGQLSLLMTPRLGVKSVSNPLPTSGADEPESLANIRKNLPLTVLTLDRIVSLQDYENFTRAFAGIGKARADILWKGEDRTIHLTVAASDEGGIDAKLEENLILAFSRARHQNFEVVINSYEKKLFGASVKIQIYDGYLEEKVISSVQTALVSSFDFRSRDFGQNVTPSEVIATIQSVEGVVAVDLDTLGDLDPFSEEHFRLVANIAHWDADTGGIHPAQLLMLDSEKTVITIM